MDEEFLLGPGIDPKKRFELFYDSLKDAYKEIIDASFKISTILLAVLAWFVSKNNPLGMLCSSRTFTYFALTFTALGWLLLIYLFHIIYFRAKTSYETLVRLGYDGKLFSHYKITRYMLWTSLFGQFTMLLGIFSLLYFRYINIEQVLLTCK